MDLIFTKEYLQIFTKECHLLSDKLESMEICLRETDTFIRNKLLFFART